MFRYIAVQELTCSLYYQWSNTLHNVAHCCMFQGCYTWSGTRGMDGEPDGPGVDTDFILYVSAKSTFMCGMESVGYATHCQQENALDR